MGDFSILIDILSDTFFLPTVNMPFYNAFDFNHRLTYFLHKPMIINRDLLEIHLEDTVCPTIHSEPCQARPAFPLFIRDILRIYLKRSRLGSP